MRGGEDNPPGEKRTPSPTSVTMNTSKGDGRGAGGLQGERNIQFSFVRVLDEIFSTARSWRWWEPILRGGFSFVYGRERGNVSAIRSPLRFRLRFSEFSTDSVPFVVWYGIWRGISVQISEFLYIVAINIVLFLKCPLLWQRTRSWNYFANLPYSYF